MSAKTTYDVHLARPAHRPGPRRGPGRHRQNRTSRAANRDPGRAAADEALFYRARLILGETLPRPSR